MENNELLDSVRENLNGRPGQPMLFGVCESLARRSGHEPWMYRAAAIVLLIAVTAPTVVAYILLGIFLEDTSERTRGIFQGLAVTIREVAEKFFDGLGNLFKPPSDGNSYR